MNDSTNDLDPIGVPKIQKPKLGVRKLGGSDIKWSNPLGNQVTHFIGCIESISVENFFCNHKKTRITSDVGPMICVSFANK
jgi:hypothetical protein